MTLFSIIFLFWFSTTCTIIAKAKDGIEENPECVHHICSPQLEEKKRNKKAQQLSLRSSTLDENHFTSSNDLASDEDSSTPPLYMDVDQLKDDKSNSSGAKSNKSSDESAVGITLAPQNNLSNGSKLTLSSSDSEFNDEIQIRRVALPQSAVGEQNNRKLLDKKHINVSNHDVNSTERHMQEYGFYEISSKDSSSSLDDQEKETEESDCRFEKLKKLGGQKMIDQLMVDLLKQYNEGSPNVHSSSTNSSYLYSSEDSTSSSCTPRDVHKYPKKATMEKQTTNRERLLAQLSPYEKQLLHKVASASGSALRQYKKNLTPRLRQLLNQQTIGESQSTNSKPSQSRTSSRFSGQQRLTGNQRQRHYSNASSSDRDRPNNAFVSIGKHPAAYSE